MGQAGLFGAGAEETLRATGDGQAVALKVSTRAEGLGELALMQELVAHGIMPGDFLLVERPLVTRDGDLVFARVGPGEGERLAVRKYYRESACLRLAAPGLSDLVAARVDVLGVVKGVVRRYV